MNLVYTSVVYINYDTSTYQVICSDRTSGYDCQLPKTTLINFDNPDSKPAIAFLHSITYFKCQNQRAGS